MQAFGGAPSASLGAAAVQTPPSSEPAPKPEAAELEELKRQFAELARRLESLGREER
jgi:hypothetical protein